MNKILFIHIVFLILPCTAWSQVDTLPPPTEVQPLEADTTGQEELPEPGQVTPWLKKVEIGNMPVTNDSLLRWQIWPNWGDYQAYRRDVISFRQGTIGRVDAYHINGYQPYEQKLRLAGISLNDPMTGLPNYNLVPQRKIGRVSENYGGSYRSEINIREYYLTKPRSYLNYDEADGAYRNLEFLVSQNFAEQTNVELSYWDRRGGAYYPNSEVSGNQIVAKAYHHLGDRFLVKGFLIRNQFNNEEPFGYSVGDPAAFGFDEFNSTPFSSGAKSEFTRSDMSLSLYHRSDEMAPENAGLELITSKNQKKLNFSGDTLSHNIRTIGGNLFKSIEWGRLNARGEVRLNQHNATNRHRQSFL